VNSLDLIESKYLLLDTSKSTLQTDQRNQIKSNWISRERSNSFNCLQWQLTNYEQNCLTNADQHLIKLIQNTDLHVMHFNHFGRNWVKQACFSPDAFIQVALQVTFYKLCGRLTCSYESASLRHFRQGRLEIIRSNTPQVLNLARVLCNQLPNVEEKNKSDYLKAAINKQVQVMNYVLNGEGIDNHLTALKEVVVCSKSWNKKNIKTTSVMPQIFTNCSFEQFNKFELVSSQVPSRQGIITGYGPLEQKGFACCYNPLPDQINFMISSLSSKH